MDIIEWFQKVVGTSEPSLKRLGITDGNRDPSPPVMVAACTIFPVKAGGKLFLMRLWTTIRKFLEGKKEHIR